MGQDIVLLLVVGLIELPLVNHAEFTPEVHLVVLHDLLDSVLRVAHQVEELVVEHVSVVLLPLLQRVEAVQVRQRLRVL